MTRREIPEGVSTDIKPKRGFATLSLERRREIASKGGKVAHAKGTAHEFTTEQAIMAGTKGGSALVAKRGKEHMSELGKKGGLAVSLRPGHMSRIGILGGQALQAKHRAKQDA